MSVGAGKDRRPLIDTIGVVDPRLEEVIDRESLQPLLAALPLRKRRILAMRFLVTSIR